MWDGYQVLGWDESHVRIWLMTDSVKPSGVGTHLLALAKGMKDRFSVTVAAPRCSGLVEAALRAGIAAVCIDPDRTASVAHLLESDRTDLVHVHAGIGWEGHQLAAAARRAGVPVVIRTDHLPYLLTDPDEQLQYTSGLNLVDKLICVGRESAESHVRAGVPRDKLRVIRNGVDAAVSTRLAHSVRADLRLPHGPVVLMAGRFTDQKGHDLLLRSWPRVLESEPGATLLLCGDGPLFQSVADQAVQLGIRSRVKLLGHRSDILDLMTASDLLVLPSRFEGLPLVVLEAMAAGLPVVATDVPGTSETVVDGLTGRLCRPGDSRALADTIVEALRSPLWLANAGRAARAHYEREFTAERMIAETLSLYCDAGVSAVTMGAVA